MYLTLKQQFTYLTLVGNGFTLGTMEKTESGKNGISYRQYAMIEKIDPLKICTYLSESGWKIFPTQRDYLKIFQYQYQSNFFQVTVPLKRSLSDYEYAMYRVICTIAEKESKSTEEVILLLLQR